jgi:protein involved in polysaccharide export with SLBB domain
MNLLNRLFLLLLCFVAFNAAAQLPADLSNVRAAQITDAQLQRIVTQAQSSGMTPQQLETELLRRGLPPSELAEIKQRIEQLGTNSTQDGDMEEESGTTSEKNKRTAPKSKNNPPNKETLEASLKRSRIFGSELFANTNLSFEPDLRMATPKNYVIGPDDELLLNVYGVNLSQQTLKVSPEGTVNVKYAGIIPVAGLTIEAATSTIRSRLVRFYPGLASGQTRLSVTLGNIRSIRVILIGAINRPGTYTLPSLATLFNALYVSGGPAENGSFRNIELIRGNKVVATADLYDFLQKGDLQGNLHLEDNDVIRVPYAQKLITLTGELNRPGIFELQAGESLLQALEFAGGYKSKAFRGRITGNRYAGIGRQVLDIAGDSLQFFQPIHGDEFVIDSVINRYQNRVMITGAVFKPGAYALDGSGMTLKQLIGKAQGLKEDVFGGRAIVVRTREDLSKEYVSVELKPIITGGQDGMLLRRDDSIHVASIFDLRDTTSVSINGAVRKPGNYRYEDGLSLKSLILKADGFADQATGRGIEISRRKRNVDVTKAGSDIVEIIRVDEDKELSSTSTDIELMPFDIVTIKEDPFYKKQISVKVSGEVLMPAVYTLQSREERLSSLIRRSGGLLYTANVGGAKLVRQKKVELDTSEIKRLFATVERDTVSAAMKVEQVAKNTTEVAINLDYILKHPGSADDITLEEGDELIIPRINNTVSVSGEVFRPVDIMYERGKDLSDYLSDAGGVTQNGKRFKAFVIYPNGGSAKTRKILGIFPKSPKIQPGSSIFVPQKPKREGFDVAKAGIFISAITALITAASLLTR